MEKSCPLGHACDRCLWNVTLYRHLEGGRVEPEPTCALVASVILLDETKARTQGVQAAVESRGNAQVERQDTLLEMINARRLTGGDTR